MYSVLQLGDGDQAAAPTAPKENKSSRKATKLTAFLYCGVGAKDLDEANLDSQSVYDVITSRHDISLTYTRLREGDGLWRLWPVIEKTSTGTSGTSFDKPEIISQLSYPLKEFDSSARFTSDKMGRLALLDAAEEKKRIKIKIYVFILKGSEYDCCFPYPIYFINRIELDLGKKEKEAVSEAAKLLTTDQPQPFEKSKQAHQELLNRICVLFKKLELDAGTDVQNDAVTVALKRYNEMIEILQNNLGERDTKEHEMEKADMERAGMQQRTPVEKARSFILGGEIPASNDTASTVNENRKKLEDEDEENKYWASGFRLAVHEGARRLIVEVLGDCKRLIEECIPDLFKNDDARVARILKSFGADAEQLGISSSHLMGEALEILFCLYYLVKKTGVIRDYLSEEAAAVYSKDTALYKDFEVIHVFMSSAPYGSPFRMKESDRDRIAASLQGDKEDAKKFADRLFHLARKDRFFDVLIEIKDKDNKIHFIAAQCKARENRKAYIDVAKYVGHLALCRHAARKVGCLIRLDWVSNVYNCRQADLGGDMEDLKNDGHLELFLFESMRTEATSLFSAAEEAKKRFGSPEELKVSVPQLKTLRPFQQKAVETLYAARNFDKLMGGTVIAATGTGKSIAAFTDALKTLEEQGHKFPMLWTCPTIFLLSQSALGFSQWEKVHNANKGIHGARFYYIICSANDITTPALRSITNSQVLSIMLMHYSNGGLGHCRFFSTVEGSGGLWDVINKFIRVTRGSGAALQSHEDPVFGVHIRDEVHVQGGLNCSSYSLGLNIPSKWHVSYTATPPAEKTRVDAIKAALEAHADIVPAGADPATEIDEKLGDNDAEEQDLEYLVAKTKEGEPDQDIESVDADEDVAPPKTKRARELIEQTPEGMFGEFYNTNLSPNLLSDDPALVNASRDGLKGLQLLSDSMQFTSLSYLAEHSESDSDKYLAEQILKAWHETKSSDGILKYLVDNQSAPAKISQIVVFPVEPELTLGACNCGAKNGNHRLNCAYSICMSQEKKEEGEMRHLFRAKFNPIKMNFVPEDFCGGGSSIASGPADCLVLGIYRQGETKTLCLRKGHARGVGVHDCTEFGMYDPKFPDKKPTNLIGKALYTYTFADAFAEKEQILAKPALAVYSLDPLAIPLAAEKHVALNRVQSWLGISERKKAQVILAASLSLCRWVAGDAYMRGFISHEVVLIQISIYSFAGR